MQSGIVAVSPVIQRSFAAGELAPALAARADLAQYATGLRTCRNHLIQRSGGATNRAGTRFIGPCATNNVNVRLLRYVAADPIDSVLIEAGEHYLRFYAGNPKALVVIDSGTVTAWSNVTDYVIGDIVSSGGSVFYAVADGTNHATSDAAFWHELPGGVLEIPTPFEDTGLFNWHQSGQVISFTHRNRVASELIFVSLTRWVFRAVTTSPQVLPPQNPVLSGSASGDRSFGFVVTAAAPGTYEESEASGQVIDASIAAPTADAPLVVSWDAQDVDGDACPEYYVYCDPFANGTYGYVGTATGTTSFNYAGQDPDFTVTPPLPRVLFSTATSRPHASATYQQRRLFGQTKDEPDAVFGSRVGFISNFGLSSPLQDDDAITFKVAGNDHHVIQHMVALKHGLILLTAGGEWTVHGPDGVSLIPNGIEADQETYLGAAELVRPVVLGNSILYVQASGSKLMQIRFDVAVEGLGGIDLTVFSGHLFDGRKLIDVTAAKSPDPIVWCTRSDGTLLGLTYVPEQNVLAWHRHDTLGGFFERVCVVPGDGQDDLFVVTNRGGNRAIEQLLPRTVIDFNRDARFLDASLTYDGAPTTSVSGLDHLNGATVYALADGVKRGPFTVAAGVVNLGVSASVVHVGLAITADLETLSLDIAGSSIRPALKRIQGVAAVIDASCRTWQAGPTSAKLTSLPAPEAGTGSATAPFSGTVELSTLAAFTKDGRVFLRHTDPLPLTVLALIPYVEVGG
jgi:hypothetical protein